MKDRNGNSLSDNLENIVSNIRCQEKLQEIERLKALYKYRILDTEPEAEYDRITKLTSNTLQAPIAFISFVDSDRQWFKSKVGFGAEETARTDSFCHHTIQEQGGFMEIEDAIQDPRFMDNPYVLEAPHFRFYAGASLIDENGNALGTLCVLDQKPRSLSNKDRDFLRTMADQVMKNLDLQVAHKKIEALSSPDEGSLEYASKIQQALFQPTWSPSSSVPDHFSYLEPLSQLSGDFYWTKEHGGYFYMAAADCTGHGVPGALLSILGVSFLDKLLNEEGSLTPGTILDRLREHFLKELNANDPKHGAKDGMDASILKIPISGAAKEEEEVEVEFAGAQNPLYILRKGIAKEDLSSLVDLPVQLEDDEVRKGRFLSLQDRIKPFSKSADGVEVKGDRRPIGYSVKEKAPFKTFRIKLQKGDTCYLFSDGFADQFGGEAGKKFRYGPFKQLLTRIREKDMEEQKSTLSAVFEEWKQMGDQEQTDDVLVMGVRI